MVRKPVSYISYKDVARFAVESLESPAAKNAILELGGHEQLSQLDVVKFINLNFWSYENKNHYCGIGATLLIGSLCFQACQKDEILSGKTDMTEHNALKRVQAETVTDGDVKMVPFRGSGTWWYAAPPKFEEDEVEIVVALEGTATHLGRFQGVETYRFSYDPDGVSDMLGDFLSLSSIYTAANGDELEGYVDDDSKLSWILDDTGAVFSLTGVRIAGGTGRFENAAGWYDFSVNKSHPDDPGGTWELEGGISFGKMVPFRGKGTWQNIGFEVIAPDMIKFISEGNGTGTQIGRAQFDIELLFSFDPETGPGEYITHTTTITAANGDILIFQPCPDTPGSGYNFNPEDQEPPWTWHGKYIRLVGGTGRFENAVGGYDIWGTGNLEDEPWGMVRFEGEISTVGSNKTFRGR